MSNCFLHSPGSCPLKASPSRPLVGLLGMWGREHGGDWGCRAAGQLWRFKAPPHQQCSNIYPKHVVYMFQFQTYFILLHQQQVNLTVTRTIYYDIEALSKLFVERERLILLWSLVSKEDFGHKPGFLDTMLILTLLSQHLNWRSGWFVLLKVKIWAWASVLVPFERGTGENLLNKDGDCTVGARGKSPDVRTEYVWFLKIMDGHV